MDYTALKTLHLATIVITLTLFVLRGVWMMADSPRLQARWVRIVPHVNDTVLLASGFGLAIMLGQYPLVNGWLTAKLFALIVYIVLGTVALKDSDPLRAEARVEPYALKRGRTRRTRIAAWIAALVVFGYIVAVAVAHNPMPFL